MISFVSKGFPYKGQIEELFIVMVYCMYSQHVTLWTFSLISFFKLQHLSNTRCSLFVLKVPFKPQSVSILTHSVLRISHWFMQKKLRLYLDVQCYVYWFPSFSRAKEALHVSLLTAHLTIVSSCRNVAGIEAVETCWRWPHETIGEWSPLFQTFGQLAVCWCILCKLSVSCISHLRTCKFVYDGLSCAVAVV